MRVQATPASPNCPSGLHRLPLLLRVDQGWQLLFTSAAGIGPQAIVLRCGERFFQPGGTVASAWRLIITFNLLSGLKARYFPIGCIHYLPPRQGRCLSGKDVLCCVREWLSPGNLGCLPSELYPLRLQFWILLSQLQSTSSSLCQSTRWWLHREFFVHWSFKRVPELLAATP
uniref:Uncharacterized protein n=1 Tax=Myotis myotis TaxID=51298 RepID=A0A7J7ZXF7_MYOMY|nr:hypothetical protein mMyoMyo1_009867 [Myotis myotis]